LCTNEHAKKRVEKLCEVGGKTPNAYVIGNIMMENMELDDSILKEAKLDSGKYDIILYNPFRGHILEDLEQISRVLLDIEVIHLKKGEDKEAGFKTPFLWLRPNTDRGSEFILHYIASRYAISPAQPRPKFLSLIKHCRYFITNSSCAHYEAPFLINKKQIIQIGLRNAERESKYAKMDIPGASDNVIKILRDLETTKNTRPETF